MHFSPCFLQNLDLTILVNDQQPQSEEIHHQYLAHFRKKNKMNYAAMIHKIKPNAHECKTSVLIILY